MRLFIFATLLACGDTKTETTTSTTTDQVKTNENTKSDSVTPTTTTSNTKLNDQTTEVKDFVQKSVETSETFDANTETTNTSESKE